MAIQSVHIEQFLSLATEHPVLDVRSPGEYGHAHIPNAHSLPLFTDTERAGIGTAYKQVSREVAIKIGLTAFGPKMRDMVEQVEAILMKRNKLNATEKGIVLVHCWRGGMRSSAVAWLLDLYGFTVYLLEGGYKAYRRWVIAYWNAESRFRILAGYTGAGKTNVLTELDQLGEPVINLERLAGHRGSAFGSTGVPQPSQEMFENLLGANIDFIRKKYGNRAIWIEDESQRIGDLNIPKEFFLAFRKTAPTIFLNVSFEKRLAQIVADYGKQPTEQLINAIVRIRKRLGPLEAKTAIGHLVEGDIPSSFAILLRYYDKGYQVQPIATTINATELTPGEIAKQIQHQFI